METVKAPSSTYLHGEHPPRTGDEDREERHEKKPVMKKVKDKVKKIKNAIRNKSQGHGDDDDHHQKSDLDEGDEGFVEDDEMMEDPEVHGAPMYESSALGMRTGGKEISLGRGGEGAEGVGDGLVSMTSTEFAEDPATPKSEAETKTGVKHSPGGKAEVSPELCRSLEAATPKSEAETKTGVEDSPGGKAEVSPELCRSLEAMTVSNQNDRGETELSKDKNSSYTNMVSSAASKVYEMVADAGTAMISKMKPDARKNGDDEVDKQEKGLSIKEYVTEKLTPGEDEMALSEFITEAGQKKKTSNEAVVVPQQEGTGSDEGGMGAGVVERIRETVTSLLGSSEGSPKPPETEALRKVEGDERDET